jgi:hypothetical protein
MVYRVERIGGSCPTQASGQLEDGRPFYFRARSGQWELSVGPHGAIDRSWIGLLEWEVAEGDDPTIGWMSDQQVLAILDEHLGQQSTSEP